MEDSILSHIKDIASEVNFYPYFTWTPSDLKKTRDPFVTDPCNMYKIESYAKRWFSFWKPWCGSQDITHFDPEWNQINKWAFSWNLGFTDCKMWSTCVRFEEVMICWSLFFSYLRDICSKEMTITERSVAFGKCCKIVEHMILCVQTWRNMDDSHKLLNEFNTTTMGIWREICLFMCHFSLLKTEKDINSMKILCALDKDLSFISLESVTKGSGGVFFDSRGTPLSRLDILSMLIKENLSIHILMVKSDICFDEYNDIIKSEEYARSAVEKKKHLDRNINGTFIYAIKSLSGTDEIDEKLAYIKNLKSKLISSVKARAPQLEDICDQTQIPKLNISFPDFLR